MKSLLIALALTLFSYTTVAGATDVAPDALVKSVTDDVLSVIKQTDDKKALRQAAEQKVVPHFDFKRITELAVGAPWRQASPAQQQALQEQFRILLVNTYTSALSLGEAKKDTTVEVKPLQGASGQNEVTVKTIARQPGRQPVAIDYRLESTPEGWKVFDVIVENLSLVTNYRGSFATEISKSGIDGLIKVLQDKNRSLA